MPERPQSTKCFINCLKINAIDSRASAQAQLLLLARNTNGSSNTEEWQLQEIETALKEADDGRFASDEEVNSFFKDWQPY
jgi:predicted transcriptional regulator